MDTVRKFKFNMVEIAVAIAIVAFGLSAILGLFPTVLKQGKRASENDKTADVVSLVKAFIDAEYSAAATWSDFLNLFRSGRHGSDDPDQDGRAIDIIAANQFSPLIIEDRSSGARIANDTNSNSQSNEIRGRLFQLLRDPNHFSDTGNTPFLRFNYYRGIYDPYAANAIENSNKKLLASYEVEVWKEPIQGGLNINGQYYVACGTPNHWASHPLTFCTSGHYTFGPGATIVVRVASPAGIEPELQEVSYYRFEYLSK